MSVPNVLQNFTTYSIFQIYKISPIVNKFLQNMLYSWIPYSLREINNFRVIVLQKQKYKGR